MTDTFLIIPVDISTLDRFRKLAHQNCRTPEQQALWLIREAVTSTRSDLLTEIRRLHVRAGAPSCRVLADRIYQATGNSLSHTTVNLSVSGRTVPSWRTLDGIVAALGGDIEDFRELWGAARAAAGK